MVSVGKPAARFTDSAGLFGRQQRTPSVLGAEGVRSMGRKLRFLVEGSGDSQSRAQCCGQVLVMEVQGLPKSGDADNQGHGKERDQYPVFGGRCPPLVRH